MYKMRLWSARHARCLNKVYKVWERILFCLHPVFKQIGYERLDPFFLAIEKPVKGFLFDSQSCGQCTLSLTGMSCPRNCPKNIRNGPCGGVRSDGNCEVKPDMRCVWVVAWDGDQHRQQSEQPVTFVLPAVDERLQNTSAWLREVRKHHAHPELEHLDK